VDITLERQLYAEIPEGFGTKKFMYLTVIDTVFTVINWLYPISDELKELLIYYHNQWLYAIKTNILRRCCS
jgi:hypothetical protein